MNCNECQEIISDYIDGLLEMGEQTTVERHLADCEPCRMVRDDLLQMIHFSRQLPLHTPSSAVWARIQSSVADEKPSGFLPMIKAWIGKMENRHLNLSLPQLAASAVALAVVVSVGVMFVKRDDTGTATMQASEMVPTTSLKLNMLSSPERENVEQRISYLEASIQQRKANWDPELRQAFEKNMLYVEQSLLECQQHLDGNPNDKVSREMMLNAYREKVRLLEGFERF